MTLRANNIHYKKILYTIASSMEPIVVHCVGGTDRTGILFALLYWLFDLNSDKILEDYKLSVTGKQLFSMKDFLKFLNKTGKNEVFLGILNLKQNTNEKLKQKLQNSDVKN